MSKSRWDREKIGEWDDPWSDMDMVSSTIALKLSFILRATSVPFSCY